MALLAVASCAPPSPPDPPATGWAGELDYLARLDLLPRLRAGTRVGMVSSRDPGGGNDDGFTGAHSALRREPGGLVLLDLAGPGVVERIWSATPSEEPLELWFDGEPAPRLRIRFDRLFEGRRFPFVPPLVGRELGGGFCYVPIPFRTALRVVLRAERAHFHQFQYRLLPPGAAVESLSTAEDGRAKAALERVRRAWREGFDGEHEPGLREESRTVRLVPGSRARLFSRRGGGRVVGLELEPASAIAGTGRRWLLRARWDEDERDAVRAPAADLLGFAFGRPAARGLLLGTIGDVAYWRLPMPFERAAEIELVDAGAAEPVAAASAELRVRVLWSERPRGPDEGRLYADWRRAQPPPGEPVTWLDATGRGHQVASLVWVQSLRPGSLAALEGDDVAIVDGRETLHGTGFEDYFNGGWYGEIDRWDGARNLPTHGALAHDEGRGRSGGYRFRLGDRLSFDRSLRRTFEHGGAGNLEPADYTTLALYYGDRPPSAATEPTPALLAPVAPTRVELDAARLALELGAGTTVTRAEGGGLAVRAPAGGLVRLALGALEPGAYRVRASFLEHPGGARVALWNRERRIGAPLETRAETERRVDRRIVGTTRFGGEPATLTLRVAAGAGELRLLGLELEPLAEPARDAEAPESEEAGGAAPPVTPP